MDHHQISGTSMDRLPFMVAHNETPRPNICFLHESTIEINFEASPSRWPPSWLQSDNRWSLPSDHLLNVGHHRYNSQRLLLTCRHRLSCIHFVLHLPPFPTDFWERGRGNGSLRSGRKKWDIREARGAGIRSLTAKRVQWRRACEGGMARGRASRDEAKGARVAVAFEA
jgi:hypothetical protein